MADDENNAISLKEFFESTPPGTWVMVSEPVKAARSSGAYPELVDVELELYCDNERCNGIRVFRLTSSHTLRPKTWDDEFVIYRCKNCGAKQKRFAISAILLEDLKTANMFKYGEVPFFGPPTPKTVSDLLGKHREYYFKGRSAENQGMGIAAFAYYRRVIDGLKNDLFDKIIQVCKVLNVSPELIDELTTAKAETQFTKAMDSIKHGIPQALLISGREPAEASICSQCCPVNA
jgi:hypothetical protein